MNYKEFFDSEKDALLVQLVGHDSDLKTWMWKIAKNNSVESVLLSHKDMFGTLPDDDSIERLCYMAKDIF